MPITNSQEFHKIFSDLKVKMQNVAQSCGVQINQEEFSQDLLEVKQQFGQVALALESAIQDAIEPDKCGFFIRKFESMQRDLGSDIDNLHDLQASIAAEEDPQEIAEKTELEADIQENKSGLEKLIKIMATAVANERLPGQLLELLTQKEELNLHIALLMADFRVAEIERFRTAGEAVIAAATQMNVPEIIAQANEVGNPEIFQELAEFVNRSGTAAGEKAEFLQNLNPDN
jgi:hypothetical protein